MIPTILQLDPKQFLAEYWHKKPLLIRQAIPGFESPVSPDELAGLACEEEIESRIIVEQPTGNYQLEIGPFAEDRFAQLPESHWTLLVQAVDHWVPEVAELLEQFRFVPDWRIDDIMISYAADGGGVGPHFDNYDVFLLQGKGRRRWKIGPPCPPDAKLADHPQLKILADFEGSEEWILEPGDMLYLPPRWAHWGTGVGDDCMTYSIGFRAQSEADLIGNWCDEVLSRLSDHQRYADSDLTLQDHPAEISSTAIEKVREIIEQRLLNREELSNWFGRMVTEKKYDQPESDDPAWTEAELRELANSGGIIQRSPASKLAFLREPDQCQLFADGESYTLPNDCLPAIKKLCLEREIRDKYWVEWLDNPTLLQLLVDLLSAGTLQDESDG